MSYTLIINIAFQTFYVSMKAYIIIDKLEKLKWAKLNNNKFTSLS